MESDVEFRLLGMPELARPSGNVVFPAKGFQLLALLARAPAKRLPRKEIAALLWDSESEAVALGNLRQLLTRVRKASQPESDLIEADAKSVALGHGAALIDLILFEITSRSGSPEQALRGLLLFRGDLLDGIGEATDSFQHWLIVERAALRDRFFAAASAILLELTRFGRASEQDLRLIADRMLAIEPEREASYRSLIEAFGRNGMFAEAERLYHALIVMLEREFGTPPQPETAALVRRVLAGRHHAAGEGHPQPRARNLPRVAFLAPKWISPPTTAYEAPLLMALVEDIANELARYRSFATLAPHSTFQLRHDSGLPEDNSILRADFTVSGFIKPGARAQVMALRMADCANGEILWSGEFSFRAEDLVRSFRLLALQVATAVAASVERHLLDAMRRDGNSSAYFHYLDGQNQLKNCDLPMLRRARRCFQQATELNGGMALAHARIAQTLYLEWISLGGDDPDLLRRARQTAENAIAIDPGAGFAHLMSATVALYQRDYDKSAEKFAEAESLNPNSADLLVQYADALSSFGDNEAGWKMFQRAIDLNPMAPDHYWWAGASIAFNSANYASSIELCDRMENWKPAVRLLAASHALSGNLEAAQEYGRHIREIYPDRPAREKVDHSPLKDDAVRKRFEEGLRLAGV
ncbi:BTAD domain-containing putative transcriptional regulator [Dongia sp.]|uniref:BTAD domain-containing putative transcriptional regulator n=1 Tax=Dongia sp. TaxID=1977262 RepID=UPI0035AFAF11